VVEAARTSDKPVLACWIGEDQVAGGRNVFKQNGISFFKQPESAVEVFSFISTFYENQRQLMQTPSPLSQQKEPDAEGARLIVESALAQGRHTLTEVEAKALLSAFHIPVAQTLIARNSSGWCVSFDHGSSIWTSAPDNPKVAGRPSGRRVGLKPDLQAHG